MKKILVISMFFFIWFNCIIFTFAEDIYYANRSDILYRSHSAIQVIREIRQGEQLTILEGGITYAFTGDIERIKVQAEDGSIGWIAVDAVSISDSELLPVEITDSSWINSYYLDVLKNLRRENLFTYEPFWRDHYYNYRYINSMDGEERSWYQDIPGMSGFSFHNIYTKVYEFGEANYFDLINGKITRLNNEYLYSFFCTSTQINFEESYLKRIFSINEKGFIKISIDGDYLDVYINNLKMFTLIKNNSEIIKQFKELLGRNTCDLSSITWPRRADGTMDYPPPIDMSSYRPTHRVTENIRLRDYSNTSSLIVTTLQKDTEVHVIETGTSSTINNINAPWVLIISSTGFTGWCFSGYLEEIAVNNSAADAIADTAKNSIVSKEEAKALPFWVWIVIGAGVVVGVVVILILKKLKS